MSMIGPPPNNDGTVSTAFAKWFSKAYVLLFSIQNSGPTDKRPTEDLFIGRMYYDTDLKQPVWLDSINPNIWHDANGTPV